LFDTGLHGLLLVVGSAPDMMRMMEISASNATKYPLE
jgi:hypothetical protein